MNEKGEVASVASEDIKLGSVFPKCNLSWRNDFKWKNLNFGFMLSARFGGIVYSATQSYLDYYGVSEASAAARDFGGVTVNGSDVINAQNGIRLSEHRTVFPNTIHIAQLMYVCRKRLLDTLFLKINYGELQTSRYHW